MGKNVSLDLTGEFAVKGAAISSNSKLPDGATELLKDHVGDLNQHVNAAIKQLLNALIAGATNNATISIDSVTGLRELLNAVSGAFAFQGKCTAEELAEKEKVAGHVWQVGDKEFACNGTDWVELGFNIDLSSYALASDLTDHIGNSDVHVTEEDKAAWNGKVDTSTFEEALSGKVDAAVMPQYLKNYSAFEVYAHEADIPVGESEVLGGYVNVAIEGSRTHDVRIRTCIADPATSDIVIAWGDGTTSTLEDYVDLYVVDTDGEYDYVMSHTYEEDGKYIVKIFGSGYYSFCHPVADNHPYSHNLICRILDTDLPLASCITNISSMCRGAKHLLHVVVPSYFNLKRIINIGGIFNDCYNLLSVKGLKNQFLVVNAAADIFLNCSNLSTLEFTMPALITRGRNQQMFKGMSSYAGTVGALLPEGGFVGSIDCNNLFAGMTSLTGTVPAEKLWGNTSVNWKNTSTAFAGCPAAILAQVPESWGGLLAPDSDQGTDDL